MGRNSIIPHSFGDQSIKFRIPYTMPGEQLVDQNASGVFFPEATFLHNVDKPFEIDRMIIRISETDDSDVVINPQPAFRDLVNRVRLTVTDVSKNENLTKASHLVSTLITSEAGGDGTWEWYVPYTVVRSEGMQIGIDTDTSPGGGNNRFRVEIALQGSLIVLQPASNTR